MSTPPSDPINGRDHCVGLMLERHAESLEIARTLADLGEKFIAQADIEVADPQRLLPTCLLIRQISGLRSLCMLTAHGFHTEAVGHQRSLMEALARITALIKKPDLLQDYLVQDVLNRQKLLKDILSFRADWGPEMLREPSDEELRKLIAAAESALQDFQREQGRKARDIKTFDWAQTGGVAHLLFGRFVIASEAIHFSPKSLDHLFVTEGERLKSVRIGPEDRDIDHLVLSSCKYVFVGLQSVANLLEVAVPEDIDELYRRYETLYDRKVSESIDDAPRS